MKKTVSVLLVLILAFTCVTPAFAADGKCDCGQTPLIYVGPLGNTPIIADAGTENETQLFRFTTGAILKLVGKVLPPLFLLPLTKNYNAVGKALVAGVNETMGRLALDGDGNSLPGVAVNVELPTDPAHGEGRDYYFHYDWRLDPIEVAGQLKEFVEHVKVLTGHDKVMFKASSMGGVVAMSYFSLYGYDDVEACVFQCCPILGTNVAGEVLCKGIALDGEALYQYGSQAYPPADAEGVLLHVLFNFLYYSGLVDVVMTFGDKLLDNVLDRVFEEALSPIFGTLLGLWSFVPDEYYEQAKEINLDPATQSGLIEKADRYHYNVQGKADEILNGAVEAGVRVMIVAGCGMRRTPLVDKTIGWDSDATVDTCYASAGATVAPYGDTLPEGYTQKINDGHNHVSPDGAIDASTCILPERTWFIRGMLHANSHDGINALYANVLYSDEDFTVFSDPAYPQFLQNDKPNGRVFALGNFADGATAPTYEEGKSLNDFHEKWIAPAEDFVFGILDKVRDIVK